MFKTKSSSSTLELLTCRGKALGGAENWWSREPSFALGWDFVSVWVGELGERGSYIWVERHEDQRIYRENSEWHYRSIFF